MPLYKDQLPPVGSASGTSTIHGQYTHMLLNSRRGRHGSRLLWTECSFWVVCKRRLNQLVSNTELWLILPWCQVNGVRLFLAVPISFYHKEPLYTSAHQLATCLLSQELGFHNGSGCEFLLAELLAAVLTFLQWIKVWHRIHKVKSDSWCP